MTLTDRERAILYLLLSDGDDLRIAKRLANEIRMTKEQWEELENDLNDFITEYYSKRPKDGNHL